MRAELRKANSRSDIFRPLRGPFPERPLPRASGSSVRPKCGLARDDMEVQKRKQDAAEDLPVSVGDDEKDSQSDG